MQWKKEKNDVSEKTGFYETTYMFTSDSVVVEYQNVTDALQSGRLVFNPIPPRLFSNLFPLGGGRHVSHPVELHTNFFLDQNFSLSGLRVSIADFGFKNSGSIPSKTNIFTKKKKRYSRDLNTGPLVPKSAMLAPRPQIDKNAWKIKKFLTENFQIQNLPTI